MPLRIVAAILLVVGVLLLATSLMKSARKRDPSPGDSWDLFPARSTGSSGMFLTGLGALLLFLTRKTDADRAEEARREALHAEERRVIDERAEKPPVKIHRCPACRVLNRPRDLRRGDPYECRYCGEVVQT